MSHTNRSAEGGEPPPEPQSHPLLGGFNTENFCDEVYDYMDDNLAEAMVKMEQELIEAAAKARGADQGGGGHSSRGDIEAAIKTCCDNVQTCLQQEFDRNIDILDRYIKENVAAVAASVPFESVSAETVVAAVAGSRSDKDPAPAAGGWGAGAAATGVVAPAVVPRSGGGVGGGSSVAHSAIGGAAPGADTWVSEVEEGMPPKSLEEEEALDAEMQHLRKRRREGLRRCAAMVRKRAREESVLYDLKEFVEALQSGVTSSFDDNGLTPVTTKVQEAVQSCAELRVTADRAQALTRRLERQAEQSSGRGAEGGNGGGASSSSVVDSTVPPPRDLQTMFQRSSEQQVVAGGAAEYTALKARLRG